MPTRWSDNDVYGHVNNVVYYSLFDTMVNGWLIDTCGTDIRDLPAIGVVAETSCRFLRSTSFPEVLHVGLGLERRGRSSVVYRLAVFDPVPRVVGYRDGLRQRRDWLGTPDADRPRLRQTPSFRRVSLTGSAGECGAPQVQAAGA
jgi:hypothetical protein